MPVALVMLTEVSLQLQIQVKLTPCHSLDDKLAVMAEKEEATTPSCPFTRLKDLVLVELGVQRILNVAVAIEEFSVGLLELSHPVERDTHIFLKYLYVVLSLV